MGRYFLALVPDAAARARLDALAQLSGAGAVPAGELHLTLVFIGALGVRSEAEVLQAIGPVVGPRVLCALTGGARGPARLVSSLRERLMTAGFAVDTRPFRAHVTLARAPRPPTKRAELLAAPICWQPT